MDEERDMGFLVVIEVEIGAVEAFQEGWLAVDVEEKAVNLERDFQGVESREGAKAEASRVESMAEARLVVAKDVQILPSCTRNCR